MKTAKRQAPVLFSMRLCLVLVVTFFLWYGYHDAPPGSLGSDIKVCAAVALATLFGPAWYVGWSVLALIVFSFWSLRTPKSATK